MVGAITRPPTLCIVMEMMKEGTLYDLIHKRKVALYDAEKTHISKQLVDVYYYLHEHGIVHRDIKSHNVLIDQYYNIKICDFGLAKHKVTRIFIKVKSQYRTNAVQWNSNIYGSLNVSKEILYRSC